MRALVVTSPFGEYAKGDLITDAFEEVRAAHGASVVAVEIEDPSPQAEPETAEQLAAEPAIEHDPAVEAEPSVEHQE